MRFLSRIISPFDRIPSCRLFLAVLLLTSSPVFAETMYVSDFLIVNVKDKLEQPYSVITTVQSNQPVEILDQSGRYVQIRTETGEVGWIARQYLKKSLPKDTVIKQLETEITGLKEKLSTLEQYEVFASDPDQNQQTIIDLTAQNNNLNTEINNLVQTNEKLDEELIKLRKLEVVSNENIDLLDQYELSKNEIDILQNTIDEQKVRLEEAEETKQQLASLEKKYEELLFTAQNSEAILKEKELLKQQTAQSQKIISDLQSQVSTLRGNQLLYWFLAGAGVFIIGMIFGKLSFKKKKRLSL